MTGMMVALVTVGTFINIPTPGNIGGLVHLGTLITFAIAIKYGPKYGAIAGGIGAMIFDIYFIYLLWAPATLLIRLLMGYVVGSIAHYKLKEGKDSLFNFIALTVGGVIIVVGYFLFQSFILGLMGETNGDYYGVSAALISIPGNVIQYLIGLLALVLVKYLPELEKSKKAM
jgi:uncharacterized membrane protein